jgi:hypothetical protein
VKPELVVGEGESSSEVVKLNAPMNPANSKISRLGRGTELNKLMSFPGIQTTFDNDEANGMSVVLVVKVMIVK